MFTAANLCIILAVIILGISKTGFGGGIGILSIPLMAMAMPAEKMIAILAVLLVVVDCFANLHYLGAYDRPVLKWLLPGALLGVIFGCFILVAMRGGVTTNSPPIRIATHVNLTTGGIVNGGIVSGPTTTTVEMKTPVDPALFNRRLQLTIGLICLFFVAAQCYRLAGGRLATLPAGPASSIAIGAVAGTVSTLSHSAGPIVTLYLLQERIEKRRLIGTMLLYTLLINGIKLIGYAIIGTVTMLTVKESLWMIPFLPIGTLTGVWLSKRIPEKPFVIVMYTAAAATAGQMIFKAMG